jgi:succinoglycan biosynthesis transport protein ExoP
MYTPYSAKPKVETVDGPHGSATGLGDVFAYLRWSWGTIVLWAATFGTAALIYAMTTPPGFIARAQLMIDINKSQIFFQDSRQPERVPDQPRIESHMEILKSDRIALWVIRDLDLIEDPEFSDIAPSLFAALFSPLIDAAPSMLAALYSRLMDDEPPPRAARETIAVNAFRDRLSVRRVGQSLVIEVAFRSSDPVKAAKIANATTEAYIKNDVQGKSEAAQRGGQWLSERLAELRQQSDDALRAYERFKLVGDKNSAGEPQVKLAELESVSQSFRRMYDVFLQQFTETMQKVSFPDSDARVVSVAAVPIVKSYPKRGLIVAFGLLLGAMSGTVLSWARYTMDRSIRSPGRLVRETGVECLGAVRALRSKDARSVRRVPTNELGRENGKKDRSDRLLRLASEQPLSEFTTDIRSLKNAVQNVTTGRRPGSIGIVAAGRGEGATTIAANLSLLCAASGLRTLLIDACVDDTTISKAFTRNEMGLFELLADPQLFTKKTGEWAEQPFAVLPIGKNGESSTPGDRIGANKTALHIKDLAERFDLVVFDLPALQSSADALAIAPYLDGVLLVADFSATSLDTVSAAVAALQATRGTLFGIVLNKTPPAAKFGWA